MVFARLDAKNAERSARRDEIRASGDGIVSRVDGFWDSFHAALEEVRQQLLQAEEAKEASASPSTCQAFVDHWTSKLASARTLLADSTVFLPPYDAEHAGQLFAALDKDAQDARARIMPRKRFAFGRRKKEPVLTPGPASSDGSVQLASSAASASAAGDAAGGAISSIDPSSNASAGASAADARLEALAAEAGEEHVVRGLKGSIVVIEQADVGSTDGGDVRLVGLQDCTVLIRATGLRALRVDGLTGCRVLARPVSGSVLLHDCSKCTLQLAARQIRLHRSHDCDFFVRAASGPIIEHCTALRFAPYSLCYGPAWALGGSPQARAAEDRSREHNGQVGRDMEAAGLLARAGSALRRTWFDVKDFGWHKLAQSPHWSVIPRGERAEAAVVGGGKKAETAIDESVGLWVLSERGASNSAGGEVGGSGSYAGDLDGDLDGDGWDEPPEGVGGCVAAEGTEGGHGSEAGANEEDDDDEL